MKEGSVITEFGSKLATGLIGDAVFSFAWTFHGEPCLVSHQNDRNSDFNAKNIDS